MQNLQIEKDEFEAWRDGHLTTAVLNVLIKHASERKIALLGGLWDSEDEETLAEIHEEKRRLKARIDLIHDMAEMQYDDFASYFKTE